MFEKILSTEVLIRLKREEAALIAYFSTDDCTVCKALKPKVAEMVRKDFPEFKMVYVPADALPDAAALHQVFTVPTILVFFEGKEYIRKSRNIGLDVLHREIERPYSLLFRP